MLLTVQNVPIGALIRTEWLDTEMRVQVSWPRVEAYAELLKSGQDLGTPVVFIEPPSELMWVGDGFHRILAHDRNGAKEVEVDVQRGTRRDARMFNIKENKKTGLGLAFQKGDLAKCILFLLNDPVGKAWSAPKIAGYVGCSRGYVQDLIADHGIKRPDLVESIDGRIVSSTDQRKHDVVLLEQREAARKRQIAAHSLRKQGMTQREIAAKLGVAKATAHKYLAKAPDEFVTCPTCRGKGVVPAEES